MLVGKLTIFEMRRMLCPLKIVIAASGMDQAGLPETHVAGLLLTWSAMVRPSLSILDPASAIFLAALITSDVFLSGPLPLEKEREQGSL